MKAAHDIIRRQTLIHQVRGLVPLFVFALLSILILVGDSRPVLAHAGHDHGKPSAAELGPVAPRMSLRTGDFDLVAVADGRQLYLYLDHAADNAPVVEANVTVTIGSQEMRARKVGEGIYAVESDTLLSTTSLDIIVDVQAGATSDLLAGTLDFAEPAAAPQTRSAGSYLPSAPPVGQWLRQVASAGSQVNLGAVSTVPFGSFLAVCLGFAVIVRTSGGRPTSPFLNFMLVLAGATLLAHSALAAPVATQERLQERPAFAALPGPMESPRRIAADGSIFVPKSAQRLLDVRTVSAGTTKTRSTIALPGTIIADPGRSAVVQSLTGGRIMAAGDGLPRLGQVVQAGEPLVSVLATIGAGENATLSGRENEINLQIAQALERVRWMRARLSEGGATVSEVTQAHLQLDSLTRQRAQLRNALRGEVLTAPIDGIVASMNVRTGQIIQPQDTLFQIIDLSNLWVEAIAYGSSGTDAANATVTLPDGRIVALQPRGRSQALRDQATILHFALTEPPSGISVGAQVTVHAEIGEAQSAIVVPRDSVVKDTSGEFIVYEHVEPERFLPRPVRVEALDGERVIVRAGIEPGTKIVVRAAQFINQVR